MIGKLPWLVAEYASALVRPPERVGVDPAASHRALGPGGMDVSGARVDALGVVGRRSGVGLRAIPIGPGVCTARLVAGHHAPYQIVVRMQAAVAAAVEAHPAPAEVG